MTVSKYVVAISLSQFVHGQCANICSAVDCRSNLMIQRNFCMVNVIQQAKTNMVPRSFHYK